MCNKNPLDSFVFAFESHRSFLERVRRVRRENQGNGRMNESPRSVRPVRSGPSMDTTLAVREWVRFTKKKATKPTRDGRASAKSRRLHASSSSTLRRVRVCGARDGKHAFFLGDIVGV